jgi:sulfoxide reductase heme-binding subunit YedZ
MRIKAAKAVVFAASLIPFLLLVYAAFTDGLGVNPVETITHRTGDWTLRFLLLTLCVTPFRKLFGRPELIRFRRMLGLFAFFYGVLHFLTWLWFDKMFDWNEMLADVRKRPFITAGTAGLLAMAPLAITSTAGWIRRLGGKRWQVLHRLVYFSAFAGVVHYYWLVKSDVRAPLTYGAILALLLLLRLWVNRPSRSPTRPAPLPSVRRLPAESPADR